MSIPSVQTTARAAPATKPVAKTADFKAALARVQAPFEPLRTRAAAQAEARRLDHRTRTPEAPVPPSSRAAFASMERRMRDFAGLSCGVPAASGGGVSPSA